MLLLAYSGNWLWSVAVTWPKVWTIIGRGKCLLFHYLKAFNTIAAATPAIAPAAAPAGPAIAPPKVPPIAAPA